MSNQANLVLYVASYTDATSARQDFESLKDAQGSDFRVEGAVVMSRDADGKVDVLEDTHEAAAGATIGGGIGLVVGLFAPPLLAATAVGAGIGGLLGHLTKKHEEKQLGVDLGETLPPDSSAVVAIIDVIYLDRIEAALARAEKRINKAIDSGDYEKLEKAVAKSQEQVADAIGS